MVIGSGGVLSHAPDRAQSALMMMDAYQPEGVTMLTVDSIFMMPHLGVLSEHLYAAAKEVFERDCIVKCGHCISPVGIAKDGEPCVTVTGEGINESVAFGQIKIIPAQQGEFKTVTITPAKTFDVGEGKGKAITAKVEGGTVGIIIDARGRPFSIELNTPDRINKLRSWLSAFNLPLPS
jgi:hypothetical protein